MKRLAVLCVLILGSECATLAMEQGSSSNNGSEDQGSDVVAQLGWDLHKKDKFPPVTRAMLPYFPTIKKTFLGRQAERSVGMAVILEMAKEAAQVDKTVDELSVLVERLKGISSGEIELKKPFYVFDSVPGKSYVKGKKNSSERYRCMNEYSVKLLAETVGGLVKAEKGSATDYQIIDAALNADTGDPDIGLALTDDEGRVRSCLQVIADTAKLARFYDVTAVRTSLQKALILQAGSKINLVLGSDVLTTNDLKAIRRESLIKVTQRNIKNLSMPSIDIDYDDNELRRVVCNSDGTKLIVEPGGKVKVPSLDCKVCGVDVYDIQTGEKDTLVWDKGWKPTYFSNVKPCWSPKGERFLVDYSFQKGLGVWNINQKDSPQSVLKWNKYFGDSVHDACWSPNGKTIATIDGYKSIVLWDAKTGDKKDSLELDYRSQAISPIKVMWNPNNENEVASRLGSTVNVWDVKKRKITKVVDVYEQELRDEIPWMVKAPSSQLKELPCDHYCYGCTICDKAAYSSDRRMVARLAKCKNRIELINRDKARGTGFDCTQLDSFGGKLESVQFSSNDTVLVATVDDNSGTKYRVYDLAGGLRKESTSSLLLLASKKLNTEGRSGDVYKSLVNKMGNDARCRYSG